MAAFTTACVTKVVLRTGKHLTQNNSSAIKGSRFFSVMEPLDNKSSMPAFSPNESKEIKEKAHVILKRKPSKPLSSFLIFAQEKRSEVLANNPDYKRRNVRKRIKYRVQGGTKKSQSSCPYRLIFMTRQASSWISIGTTFEGVGKIMGSIWRQLSSEEVQHYAAISKPYLDAYKKEMVEFKKNLTKEEGKILELYNVVRQQEIEKKKLKKALRMSEKPKAALKGFALFSQLHRDTYDRELAEKDKSQTYLVQMSKLWASLSEEKKEQYNERASSEADFANKENSLWVQNMVLSENYEVLKRRDVQKELERLGKPSLRKTALALFVHDHIKEYGNLPMASKAYHDLPEHEKAAYKMKAEKEKEEAMKEYEVWKEGMEKAGKATFVEMAEKFLSQRKK